MPEGKIKKVIAEKGFGFIEKEDGDVFFHQTALLDAQIEELREGELVTFDVGQGPKGPRAENVAPA